MNPNVLVNGTFHVETSLKPHQPKYPAPHCFQGLKLTPPAKIQFSDSENCEEFQELT